MEKCLKCGTAVAPTAKFCGECGTKIEQAVKSHLECMLASFEDEEILKLNKMIL